MVTQAYISATAVSKKNLNEAKNSGQLWVSAKANHCPTLRHRRLSSSDEIIAAKLIFNEIETKLEKVENASKVDLASIPGLRFDSKK